ncbi:hypothetical protein Tco_0945015 [Tanacetum coccineum]
MKQLAASLYSVEEVLQSPNAFQKNMKITYEEIMRISNHFQESSQKLSSHMKNHEHYTYITSSRPTKTQSEWINLMHEDQSPKTLNYQQQKKQSKKCEVYKQSYNLNPRHNLANKAIIAKPNSIPSLSEPGCNILFTDFLQFIGRRATDKKTRNGNRGLEAKGPRLNAKSRSLKLASHMPKNKLGNVRWTLESGSGRMKKVAMTGRRETNLGMLIRSWNINYGITTRNMRTGDGLFPGDICRWGICTKRQK